MVFLFSLYRPGSRHSGQHNDHSCLRHTYILPYGYQAMTLILVLTYLTALTTLTPTLTALPWCTPPAVAANSAGGNPAGPYGSILGGPHVSHMGSSSHGASGSTGGAHHHHHLGAAAGTAVGSLGGAMVVPSPLRAGHRCADC